MYRNECEAQQAGVSIASQGECSIACETNEQCPSDQYCERSIGDCQSPSMCRMRLAQCADVWSPVCGCDGRTHRNPCEASRDGTTIAHFGPCATCQASDECAQGEYCHKEEGCEGSGVCLMRPDACTEQWVPVCGCDGITYSNTCHAEAAGANVAFAGQCARSRADLDADHDVDGKDLRLFVQCKTGPAIPQTDPICAVRTWTSTWTSTRRISASSSDVSVAPATRRVSTAPIERPDGGKCVQAVRFRRPGVAYNGESFERVIPFLTTSDCRTRRLGNAG